MMQKKPWNMTETQAHGYLSESTQREQYNEYQQGLDGYQKYVHDLVLWTKVV